MRIAFSQKLASGLTYTKRALTAALLAVAAVALVPFTGQAQSNAEGYIYGSGPAGATVTAQNVGTGLTRSATISNDGSYTVPSLPTGTYTVTAKQGDSQIGSQEDVIVSVGAGSAVRFSAMEKSEDGVQQLSKFVVSSSTMAPIDTSRTGAALSIRKETVDDLPVIQSLAGVMLLAPQVTKGDAAFGDVPSFAGASVAENNYFVNGFNITDFRHGTNYSRVPFDFQESFQVMVGGYGPEYGRSLGGVTNTVTKSGSNKLVAGAAVYYEPDGSHSPDVYDNKGKIHLANSLGKSETTRSEIYAGFPIVKNHLFFYGLYEARNVKSDYAGTYATSYYKDVTDNPFWGIKGDYFINSDHHIEFTAFSDLRTTTEDGYNYSWASKTVGSSLGQTFYHRGGVNRIYRYSGKFGDRVNLSVMYGKGGYNLTTNGTGDAYPAIYDGRSGSLVPLGSWSSLTTETASDQREAYRVDGSIDLGLNNIKFGADFEDNLSNDLTSYSGGYYWRYYAAPSSGKVNGATWNSQYARKIIYLVGGSYRVKDSAYYIQDIVKLMDNKLLLNVGLRSEGFKNYNKDNVAFIEAKNQLAPRVSASFDPTGEGKAKIFANFGRYYLPIAANTNIRASGGEYYLVQYYQLNSVNADGLPNVGAQLGPDQLSADGTAPDPRTLSDLDLKPMYQTEYILGAQAEIAKNWTLSIRGMYRNLDSTIDDTEVEPAIDRWAARTGNPVFSPDSTYVLFNPGRDLTFMADVKGDGNYVPVTLTRDDLQMPPAIRKYYAITLELEHTYANKWFMNASYTWSHNYGNFEGWVKSDNEQNDPGISAAFDYPSFMDNTYGNLPNDRRHVFKVYGFYQATDEFTVGFNALLQSGRPISRTGQDLGQLGVSGYQGSNLLLPRGSLGNTPWTSQLDLSFRYRPKYFHKQLTLSVDVFNVFNFQTPQKYYELYEDSNQVPIDWYGKTEDYQEPRYFRFSVAYKY